MYSTTELADILAMSLVGHTDSVIDVTSAPVNNVCLIGSCSDDGSIKIWDLRESKWLLRQTLWHNGSAIGLVGSTPQDMRLLPSSIDWNGAALCAGYRDGSVASFDYTTGQRLRLMKDSASDAGTERSTNVLISDSAGQTIVAAHHDGLVSIFDTRIGKQCLI